MSTPNRNTETVPRGTPRNAGEAIKQMLDAQAAETAALIQRDADDIRALEVIICDHLGLEDGEYEIDPDRTRFMRGYVSDSSGFAGDLAWVVGGAPCLQWIFAKTSRGIWELLYLRDSP